jgi:hypothetical protein
LSIFILIVKTYNVLRHSPHPSAAEPALAAA